MKWTEERRAEHAAMMRRRHARNKGEVVVDPESLARREKKQVCDLVSDILSHWGELTAKDKLDLVARLQDLRFGGGS